MATREFSLKTTNRTESSRGALYIVWDEKADDALARSITSLNRVHPEMPVHVARIRSERADLLCKCGMFDLSPFAETVYLDVNTVVLGDLGFAFNKAARFGIACCISPSVWARQHIGVKGDAILYNTGMLFFTQAAKPVFNTYLQLSAEHAKYERSQYMGPGTRTTHDDEGCFAAALEITGWNPFVLPPNWNFRPGIGHRDIVGPIKIWHHYVDPPAAMFVPDFGVTLHHAKVEDLFPLRRVDALRFGSRLVRHALGLRKRQPLFPMST
jgi:hypothetical protein